jgi:hypothetical protein
VAEIMEPAHPDTRLLLGADEPFAGRRCAERSAVAPAEDDVVATGELSPPFQAFELLGA